MNISMLLLPLLIACGGPSDEASHEGHAHEEKAEKPHDGKGHDHDHKDAAGVAIVKATDGASVMFLSPQAGATLKSPVKVKMGIKGMTVKPAGEVVEGTGHHHILIDTTSTPQGEAVPADETHIHFGKGQTEVDLELQPGKHTLTLQFADGVHRSYGQQMSSTIDIIVEE